MLKSSPDGGSLACPWNDGYEWRGPGKWHHNRCRGDEDWAFKICSGADWCKAYGRVPFHEFDEWDHEKFHFKDIRAFVLFDNLEESTSETKKMHWFVCMKTV